jgi:tetratricopeptide (TPR) repeat protein
MLKWISTVLSLIFFAATPLLIAATPKPRPALQPLLEQLAQNPDDAALRTRIIGLVLGMPHPPKVSEQFNEQIGAAGYAFKHATSQADFQASIDAFKKASLLAPWIADVYYNIALADEKVQNFDDAITNLHWYLIAKPNAADTDRVQQKIGALQYEKQQKATVKTQATAAAQASAAVQVAAAQAAARRAAAMQALKQATLGAMYEAGWCSATHQAGVGCDEAEYNGRNWYWWAGSAVTFGFPGVDTAVIYAPNNNGINAPSFRGIAHADGSIAWQCSAAETVLANTGVNSLLPNVLAPWSPAWIEHDAGWTFFNVSCDRPAVGPSPSFRYHYNGFKRLST